MVGCSVADSAGRVTSRLSSVAAAAEFNARRVFIDSTELTALIDAFATLTDPQRTLCASRPGDAVVRLFALTTTTELFHVIDVDEPRETRADPAPLAIDDR